MAEMELNVINKQGLSQRIPCIERKREGHGTGKRVSPTSVLQLPTLA
jgi:hypothetical protein